MKTISTDKGIPFLNKVIDKLNGTKREQEYYQNFFKDIEYPNPTKGNVLMYVGVGHMYMTPIEILMYHLLKKQGFSVDYCIYDKDIPINEVITKERVENQGKDHFWSHSVDRAHRLLCASNVEYENIKTTVLVKDMVENLGDDIRSILSFSLDNIDFGDIVTGAIYRYYKSLTFGEDVIDVARKFMRTALTNYFFIKEKARQIEYDFVFFSHGIYCTWGPIVEWCRKNDTPYICYDRAKTKANCNFNLNLPSPIWDISAAWDRLKDYDLSTEESLKVEQYLESRILQKDDVYAYNFSNKEDDISQLRNRLGINQGAKVITIFTNLIWDAANVSRDIAFSSPLDCIIKTVKKYQNNPNVHIIVRTHPAEKVLGTKERYGKLVHDTFDILPKNLSIIEPEDNINSFSVLELSDIGVVHTSTVGLEMAIEGKPVILISETHYRGKGFTYDAQSEEDYYIILQNLIMEGGILPNQVKLAKKYFYIMMFEYQHLMPMTFTDKGAFNGYGVSNFAEFEKDKSKKLNKIIDRIGSQEIFDDLVFR